MAGLIDVSLYQRPYQPGVWDKTRPTLASCAFQQDQQNRDKWGQISIKRNVHMTQFLSSSYHLS